MKRWITYGLYDPRTNALRYVGKTGDEMSRRSGHRAQGGTSHYGNWKRELLAHGLAPVFRELAEHKTEAAAYAAEIDTIARCRAEGCDLTNTTAGGGGESGIVPVRKTPGELRAAREARAAALQAQHPGCFVGWGSIAAALGVSESTAQRMEREESLPVRRVNGQIVAAESEMEAWQQALFAPALRAMNDHFARCSAVS